MPTSGEASTVEERHVVVAVAQEAQIGEQVGHLLGGVVAAAGRPHGAQMVLAERGLVQARRPSPPRRAARSARASPRRRRPARRCAGASARASAPRQLSPASRNAALSVRSSSTRPPAGGSPAMPRLGQERRVAGRRSRARTPRSRRRSRAAASGGCGEARSGPPPPRHAARGRPRRRRGGTGRCSGTRRRRRRARRRRTRSISSHWSRFVSWNSSTSTSANRSR